MKISQAIQAAQDEKRPWCSFEFFPPKTAQGLVNLYDRMARMTRLGPTFIDVTWGAGGSTSDTTTQIVRTAQEELGLETCMHLTCTNMPREQVHKALVEAKEHGCKNVLALRGDPPRGATEWQPIENGFVQAVDLIRYIRTHFGDHFDIAIAGFPEGHPDSPDRKQELQWVKEKVDAGANFIITQMFYDADVFINWARDLRAIGVKVPIVPGIMPIQGWDAFIRRTNFAKTIIPQHFIDTLEPIKNDDAQTRDVGTRLVADMCRKILDSDLGITGLHIYTMNLERGTIMLLEALNFVPSVDVINPLPWRPALTEKRRTETTRPIFWANRHKSYLARTADWSADEFPNGRWGDSKSAAFGSPDGYGLKHNKEEAHKLWGQPSTFAEVAELFAGYCMGSVSALPWSEQPPAKETNIISESLAQLNKQGYLTINSQPAVDGADSSDPTHGWGPRYGYVYQKAYLEFFCSPENFQKILPRLSSDPSITYYAVTKTGDLHTNASIDLPNAVTWGCFPGREIIQPTIVERMSFMAWKDEAFEIGKIWASMYEPESAPRRLISDISDSFFLVNIVRNDFRNPDRLAIFRTFQETAANGTNGAAAGQSPSHDRTVSLTTATEGLTDEATQTLKN